MREWLKGILVDLQDCSWRQCLAVMLIVFCHLRDAAF